MSFPSINLWENVVRDGWMDAGMLDGVEKTWDELLTSHFTGSLNVISDSRLMYSQPCRFTLQWSGSYGGVGGHTASIV